MGGVKLSKPLIQFSVNGWSCISPLDLAGGQTMAGLVVTSSKRAYATKSCRSQDCGAQCPWPHGRPLSTHASAIDYWTLRASLAQALVGPLLLSLGSWCTERFVCVLHESVSPVLWNSVINSHGPSKSNFLGILSLFDNQDGVITQLEPDILECEVKWALGSITVNKASGGDGIPAELFQILKDDAVKVLHSVCQQIWKTQQWPQEWKMSVFIPIPKKGNA